ncbi:ABC transporter ATP-binding protein [Alphaproteobacteria bacterium]|nr:ABC transporter ATP-binding protein [Alphaproteobacteria bacterium]
MSHIQIRSLKKSFGVVDAVKNINFNIDDGQFVVLVGPSGCGKTTTLRMLAGFEDPTEGEILIGDNVVNDIEPGKRGIGMVFQNHALFPNKTVEDNIKFGLRMKKMSAIEMQKKLDEVSKLVQIGHLLKKMPFQCSGGESQRIALARTLVTEPQIFLLDEPLSSLDAKLRRELRAECGRIHKELGKTFIYVTHDQEEAMTLADKIVIMNKGDIEQIGTPDEIYNNPKNFFVADFFGSPSMNFCEGTNNDHTISTKYFTVKISKSEVKTLPNNVTIGIRPEKTFIKPSKAKEAHKIQVVEPLGREKIIYLDARTDQKFVSLLPSENATEIAENTTVAVNVTPKDIFIFDLDGNRLK